VGCVIARTGEREIFSPLVARHSVPTQRGYASALGLPVATPTMKLVLNIDALIPSNQFSSQAWVYLP
jgi:hypothetical protein